MKISVSQLLATIAGICGIATGFYYMMGGYDSEVVTGLQAPETQVEVSSLAPLRVPFQYPEYSVVGVDVYPVDTKSAHTNLDVIVLDSKGGVVGRKVSQRTIYTRSENPKITVYLAFHKTMKSGQNLQLVIATHAKNPVYLIANMPEQEGGASALVFSLLHRVAPTYVAQQGVRIALVLAFWVVALGVIKTKNELYSWLFAGIGVVVFSVSVGSPYLYHGSFLGINDWDHHYSLAQIYTTTLKSYHQFPLWNPYFCGGTSALGDPEFPVFTPAFVFEVLFGVSSGISYAIITSFIVVGLGMLFLARRVGLSPEAAFLSASILLFSSALFLKATEGHTPIIFAFMWVPWILFAWLEKRIFICALCIAMVVLQGGIYILSYVVLCMLGIVLLRKDRVQAFMQYIKIMLWAVGLSSVQLIPTLLWLKEYPDKSFVGSAFTYNAMSDVLFGRYLDHTFILMNQVSDWHEYGAYIGFGVVALICVGISYMLEKKIVRVLVYGMLLALFVSSIGPIFQHVLTYAPYIPRSNISRLILFSLLCGALLAGFGMKRLIAIFPKAPIIPLVIAGYICIDLVSLAYPIAYQAFVVPRMVPSLPQAQYPIEYVSDSYSIRKQGFDFPRSYEATLRGYGTFAFCSPIGPDSAVAENDAANPRRSFIQTSPSADATLTYWSPNAFTIHVSAATLTDVTVNMNYARGWRVVGGTIVHDQQRLTIRVPAGVHDIRAHYDPPGALLGLCITITTILCVCIILDNADKRAHAR